MYTPYATRGWSSVDAAMAFETTVIETVCGCERHGQLLMNFTDAGFPGGSQTMSIDLQSSSLLTRLSDGQFYAVGLVVTDSLTLDKAAAATNFFQFVASSSPSRVPVIVGATVGAVGGVVLLGLIVWCCCRNQLRSHETHNGYYQAPDD